MPKPKTSTPLVSIITVVYNDYQNLYKTLESIKNQKKGNWEFIVIDGASEDGSLELAKSYSHIITHLVSEPDQGIYDAMNKGIRLAKGRYLNFMNAGDAFYKPHTLAKVEQALIAKVPHILYGKVVKLSSKRSQFYYEKGKALTRGSYFLGTPMCHQSMFIARELFSTAVVGLYDTKFKAGAFYEWLAKYYSRFKSFEKLEFMDEVLAMYLDGGFSFRQKKQVQLDRLRTVSRYYSLPYMLLNYLNFFVEYGKALVLPIMQKMKFLDIYRQLKYRSITPSMHGNK